MPHVPLRTCVSCRKKQPKSLLFRIIRTPKGVVKVAESPSEKGRGVYLCKNRACIELAFHGKKSEIISHFLKKPVAGEKLYETLCHLLP